MRIGVISLTYHLSRSILSILNDLFNCMIPTTQPLTSGFTFQAIFRSTDMINNVPVMCNAAILICFKQTVPISSARPHLKSKVLPEFRDAQYLTTPWTWSFLSCLCHHAILIAINFYDLDVIFLASHLERKWSVVVGDGGSVCVMVVTFQTAVWNGMQFGFIRRYLLVVSSRCVTVVDVDVVV